MRYYSIHRPVDLGAFPKTVKVNEICNNEIDIDITADNGTDTYSAIHYYYL